MLQEPRRKYLDYIFVFAISLCLVLLLAYQVTNLMELRAEQAPTATQAAIARPTMTPTEGVQATATPGPSPTPTATMILE